MSSHIERVRTESGWHGRIEGGNHEAVWTTETLVDKRSVVEAILSTARMFGLDRSLVQQVRGGLVMTFETADSDGVIRTSEVRVVDVDERTQS